MTLRDNYKEMQYRLGRDTLYDADGLPAEAALPAEWGARLVLQYNQNYESIVKANDGSLSPTGTWIELPNPKLSDLRRERDAVLPKVPGITVFDLTVALRLADGTPAVLFLSAADELGLNVISEQLYEQLTAEETLPVRCSSDIIAPDMYCFVTPDEAQRNLVVYLLK